LLKKTCGSAGCKILLVFFSDINYGVRISIYILAL
jgi:hypothetical protein